MEDLSFHHHDINDHKNTRQRVPTQIDPTLSFVQSSLTTSTSRCLLLLIFSLTIMANEQLKNKALFEEIPSSSRTPEQVARWSIGGESHNFQATSKARQFKRDQKIRRLSYLAWQRYSCVRKTVGYVRLCR